MNRRKTWRHTSGRPVPVNDIRLSPFHTLHDIKGNLAIETFWYDPGYSKSTTLFSDGTKFANILVFAKSLRTCLIQLPYRTEIEGALIRYVRALDSSDLNDAFLRLWSLLEYLTNSTIESLVFLLKRYVDSLLLFHLGNRLGFATHAETASFMDFPQRKKDIDQRIKRLREARRFCSD